MSTPASPTLKVEVSYVEQTTSTIPKQEVQDEQPHQFRLTPGLVIAFLGLYLGYLSDVFVQNMSFSLLTSINKAIGPNAQYTWIYSTNLFSSAIIAPIMGRLSDLLGRRYFLVAANVFGLVGCVVAATANRFSVILGGTVLLGLASSMHQLVWAGIGELVPKKSRPLAIGVLQFLLLPGLAFSPLIAYTMNAHVSWRDVYWLPFALNIFSLFAIFFFYHPIKLFVPEDAPNPLQLLRQYDYIGTCLWVIGITLGACGLAFGGSMYHWATAGILAPCFLGLVTLIIFLLYEGYVRKSHYAFLPRAVWKHGRGYCLVVAGLFFYGLTYFPTYKLWQTQVNALYTTDSNKIGLYTLALGLPAAVFGAVFGIALPKFGHAAWIFAASMVILTVVVGAQAIVSPSSAARSTVLVSFTGAMSGIITTITMIMIELVVDTEHLGFATTWAISLTMIGGAISGIVDPVMLTNTLSTQVKQRVVPLLVQASIAPENLPTVLAALEAGEVASLVQSGLNLVQIQAAVNALEISYARGFRLIYLVSITFGVLGSIIVAFSKDVRKRLTSGVDVRLGGQRGFKRAFK